MLGIENDLEAGSSNERNVVELSYSLSRLEGGSTVNEEDELKEAFQDPTEAETATPAPKAAPKKAAPPPSTELREPATSDSPTKFSVIFKYAKISVLVIVLLITIILLAINKVPHYKSRLVSVEAKKVRIIILTDQDYDGETKTFGVKIMGPFLISDDCNSEDPKLHVDVVEAANVNGSTFESTSFCLFTKDNTQSSNGKINKHDADKKDRLKEHTFEMDNITEDTAIALKLYTVNIPYDICLNISTVKQPINKDHGIVYGSIVLVFLYSLIVTEIIDRTFASLIAAGLSLGVLALCHGKADQTHLIHWIDIDTLALLVGMMLIVSILAESGLFDYFAVYAYKVAKGRIWPLINCLSLFTAVLAMFLDSVTMMLLATPVTIRLCEVLALDPVPILITMVLFANVGAASTPVGDPPNVIISLNTFIKSKGVNFGNFTLHMAPGVVLALIQTYIHIRLLFRKPKSMSLQSSKELEDLRHEIAVWERTAAGISPYSQDEDVAREAINERIEKLKQKLEAAENSQTEKVAPSFETTLEQLTKQYPLRDKALLIKAGITFLFVLILFLSHSIPDFFIHISLGWSALIGAFLLLIISDRRDLEAILIRIEWSTLLFFAALFIVMESLSLLGIIDLIGTFVVDVISSVGKEYQLALAIVLIVWVSGVASAFLDNVPVATMMIKIVIRLSEDAKLTLPLHPLVWSLAFGACFGGNGTLIGASANVVTAGVSEQHGYKITFIRFFIICFPVMLGNLVIATLYLLLAHVAFTWHDNV